MPRKGKRRTVAKNIYSDKAGLEAVVRVSVDGEPLTRSKRYEHGTEIKTIRTWQRDTENELRKLTGVVARETFTDQVEQDYLPLVREELASYDDRVRDIRAWIPLFGTKKRHQIRTAAIDKQLRTWRNVDGLSASTVNHRRDALSDFFQKLNGSEGANPVKGAVWFAREKPKPKGIDRARILRVLEQMDCDRKTRWRLLLMHWTGMRPTQMGRLAGPDDFYVGDRAFELEVRGELRRVPAVLVPTGKGGDPVMMPLTPEGEDVATHFIRVDAFWRPPATPRVGKDGTPKKPRKTWSCPSAYKRIVVAAAHVRETPFTVYTIKHSFATGLRRTGTDLKDIQDMLGHVDMKSTEGYAPRVEEKHVAALDRLRADDQRRYHQKAEREAEAKGVALNRGSETDAA